MAQTPNIPLQNTESGVVVQCGRHWVYVFVCGKMDAVKGTLQGNSKREKIHGIE